MKDHELFNLRNEGTEEADKGAFDLDFAKLVSVLRKSLPFVLGILIACLLISHLVVRYTKPLYQSDSVLQLDIKSEASILGFRGMETGPSSQNVNGMSEEIELIKSKLFLSQVIKALDLDVSYYAEGKILDDEKYRSAPFRVEYLIKNEGFFNKKINVDLIDEHHYRLSFVTDGTEFSQQYRFGQKVSTPYLNVTLSPTSQFSSGAPQENPYYFIINSDNALIQYFRDNLSVQVLNLNAKTINVSFTDHNAYKARTLVDVLSNLYLAYTKEEKNLANTNKLVFLNTQLEETEDKLEDYETYFESFTIDNKTTNLTGDINKAISFMLEIDSQRVELRKQLAILKRIEGPESNSRTFATKGRLSPGFQAFPSEITEVLEKLNELESEKELLLESYNKNTKAYQLKLKEETLLREELNESAGLYRSEIEQQLEKLDKRRQELQASFVQLPSKGTEFNRIERNYQQLLGFLLSLQERKIEVEIANAGTTTDFKILSSASFPTTPISPDRLLINGIGLMAGLFLSLLFIGGRYLLDNKINNIAEVEALSPVPMLGALPAVRNKNQHANLLVDENPKSAFSEALRSMRTNMEFLAARQANRVISVTSTISGEGKTFVAANLAAVIAFSQKRVIVLDLDMRKPKLHFAFGGENGDKGLSTLLIGKHSIEDCIRTTKIPNLQYLPAGPNPPNPSELVMNGDFSRLLEELKKRYDMIVIDTPPVGLVTDGILIMKQADLSLYVFKADYSKKVFFKTLNRLATINQFRHMAVILNGVQSGQGYGYGYGSGNGGGYYQEE